MRRLVAERVEPKPGGEAQRLTLLFSDIAGFTSISESMSVQALADALGRYFEAVTRVIQGPESDGVIDKFIGDAVMAFWGAPRLLEAQAARACRAALAMQAVCERLCAEPGFPPFVTRIGLHTDEVLVGNFGAPDRLNYTCLGDGVNLAARLESLNKLYGTHILVSGAVWAEVGPAFIGRRLDRVAVKGQTRPVDVYELVDEHAAPDAALADRFARYETAFEAYLGRDFAVAIAGFETLVAGTPDDIAAAQLLARARRFAVAPPPEAWDGVWAMDKK